jgi:hypothetical protein
VVFSEEFVEDFKTVNDRKSRQDHETKNTNKSFWVSAAMAYNQCEEDVPTKRKNNSPSDTDNTTKPPSSNDYYVGSSDSSFEDSINSDYNNSKEDMFNKIIVPEGDVHLSDLSTDTSVNLLDVDQFQTDTFRKKMMELFKIRRVIKQNMTQSGTHDSEVWNFVESAMVGFTGFTKISVYYFTCDANKIATSTAISSHS